MASVDTENSLAIRAVWLHYAGGLTQAAVAERLGIASVKAHRLIARAVADGVVKMTIDGDIAMIGSANLDRRSFELNYEVNMAVFDPALIAELDARQASYVRRSRRITLDEVRGWSLLRRLRNNLMALASPLL